jgi:DNA-binding NarL/FixJ family response regulator
MSARVVLADDHPVFRRGLRMLLDEIGVTVLAEAEDGEQALLAVLEHRPDVVLMDLQMPRLDGVEATRQVLARAPQTRVLVLTMVEDDDAVFAAVRAGARGYLLKGAGAEEIGRALEAVAAGEVVYGRGVADRVMRLFAAGAVGRAVPFGELTEREREVLDHLAAGRSNGDIARRTFLSEKTVRNYVSSIFTKIGVADRAEAIVRARAAGLGGGP